MSAKHRLRWPLQHRGGQLRRCGKTRVGKVGWRKVDFALLALSPNPNARARLLRPISPACPPRCSRFSGRDISSDHIQVIAGGFERLLCIMVRNKPDFIIKGRIARPARRSNRHDDRHPTGDHDRFVLEIFSVPGFRTAVSPYALTS